MKRFPGHSARLLTCLAAVLLLTACGAGSNSSDLNGAGNPDPVGNNPPPQEIQGVATPSTVSVVTATNAD